MSAKIAKVSKKVGPADLPHIDHIVTNMIRQAQDRAIQEGGVIFPNTTVKIIVEQEFTSGD